MSRRDRGGARRAYRLLLRAFPREVRERWGDEMEETFLAILDEEGRGVAGRAGVWLEATADALRRGVGMRLGGGRGERRPEERDPRHGPGRWGRRERRTGDVGMGTLINDIRYAIRSMVRRPVFTATAVATLALGIGADTAIFSLVNGLLVRPLPYPDADELVTLYAEHRELGWERTDINPADAWDWHRRSGVFEELAVWDEVGLNLTGGEHPVLALGIRTTPSLLRILGASPMLGRDLTAEDARPGAPLAVILEHGFWQRRYGGDPSVLGTTLVVNDEPGTVVGILSGDFVFPDEHVDVFVPMREDPATAERGGHYASAYARLRAGVTVERAERAVNEVARALQDEHPGTNEGWTAEVVSLRDDLLGEMAKQASLVLLAAVGFVLLMACTNVANLLLARGASRRSELALRRALGAGRGRILVQLLVESTLLAVAGGTLGLALAWTGERALVAGLPDNMPPAFTFGLDGTVLAFAAVVTVGTVVVFGLLPAIRAARRSEVGDLRDGGRGGSPGSGLRRFGSALVVIQTALAVVLLVGGGLMIRSVAGMASRDLGFEAEGVLALSMTPPETRYEDREALHRFWTAVRDEVEALPGVASVGTIQALPLGGSNWGGTAWWAGSEDPEVDPGRRVRHGYVSPGYFETMGIDVLRGRDVGPEDVEGPPVALVNEAFAERDGGGGDVLGRTLRSSGLAGEITIVGVVEDHVERGIDSPPEPALYFPVSLSGVRTRTLVVRTGGDPTTLVDPVQAAVWGVDADQPVYEVATMEEWVTRRIGGFRILAEIMGVFGLLALVLGAVGIYGVTAYAVGRRTGEIGVRMAMGADRRAVVGMVLREGLGRIALGLAAGLGLALLLSRGISGILVDVTATDPLTYGTVVTVLFAVALLGSWLPARRASRVDPVRALSAE